MLARRALIAAPRVSLRRSLQTGPRDTSTSKQTLPGDITDTAWKARKTASREVGVLAPWPALFAVVGLGAITLYFTSGKGKTELANNMTNTPDTFKK